jgi:hypothetical protein
VRVRVPRSEAVQGVDLLRLDSRDGRRDSAWVAGGDPDLGALAVLALAHLLGDLGRQLLGAQCLREDRLVDRLVDDLLEAGHMHASLSRIEIDETLELGEEEASTVRQTAVAVGGGSAGDVDDLLDPSDAYAGQSDLGRGPAGLDVSAFGGENLFGLTHLD